MSLNDFLQMGGYGAYVWSCYGLTALVLIGLGWAGRHDLKAARTQALRRAQIAADRQP